MGKAEPGSANHVLLWNTALLEVKFSHHGGARAQHAMHRRNHQSGRVSLHKKGTRPALAFGNPNWTETSCVTKGIQRVSRLSGGES